MENPHKPKPTSLEKFTFRPPLLSPTINTINTISTTLKTLSLQQVGLEPATPTLPGLPTELIDQIFESISTCDKLCITLTCKRFYSNLKYRSLLIKNPRLQRPKIGPPDIYYSKEFARNQFLAKLQSERWKLCISCSMLYPQKDLNSDSKTRSQKQRRGRGREKSDSDSDSDPDLKKCPKCGNKKRKFDYGSFHGKEEPIVEICPCFGISISGQRKLLRKCFEVGCFYPWSGSLPSRYQNYRDNRCLESELEEFLDFERDNFAFPFHLEPEYNVMRREHFNDVPVHHCTTEYIGPIPVLHEVSIRGLSAGTDTRKDHAGRCICNRKTGRAENILELFVENTIQIPLMRGQLRGGDFEVLLSAHYPELLERVEKCLEGQKSPAISTAWPDEFTVRLNTSRHLDEYLDRKISDYDGPEWAESDIVEGGSDYDVYCEAITLEATRTLNALDVWGDL